MQEPAEIVRIQLTESETIFAHQFLGRSTADPECEDTPLTKSAAFTLCPGLEVDVKLCNGDSPYVDPVLFFNGSEVECLNPDDTLEGQYDFIFEGKLYRVEIIGAEIPGQGKYTDLGPEAALPWIMGAASDEEAFQFMSAAGWEVGAIKLDPLKTIGEFALKAINSHDQLVASLKWIAEHAKEFDGIEDPETMLAQITKCAKETLADIR